jgi:2,4-dienoyl-CoA reductase (NADPH2)
VTIWEESDHIGGNLKTAAIPPGKREFNNLLEYFEAMLKKYDISIFPGKKAVASEIAEAGFDYVAVATGTFPNTIPLPGNHNIPVYSATDVLRGNVIAGKNVVIVGGSSVGCETAQFLAKDASASPEQIYFMLEHQTEPVETIMNLMNSTRRNISIVDIGKIGGGFEQGTGWPVMKDLKRFNVKPYPFTSIAGIDDESVSLEISDSEAKETHKEIIPCDTIIISVGSRPNDDLYKELSKLGVEAACLGDSKAVGKIMDAVREADEMALLV